jgi:putative peptidoglycan binding protein
LIMAEVQLMRTFICICVSLTLIAPQFAWADKKKSGGGGKAAAHPSGGGGSRGAARPSGGGGSRAATHPGGGFPHPSAGAPHAGGSGTSNRASMGQHSFGSNKAPSQRQTAHTQQHGLNADKQSGQHGLNAHQQTGQHGINSHDKPAARGLNATQADRQNNRAAKLSATHPVNNRVAVHNQAAAHWRSGLRYRNTHALYSGYHRVWHDRGWWSSHYSTVTYVGGPYWGGNWYWDGGYWFPAWGYDPAFVGYLYDGPIFAYNNLPPDEVVINIQEALQDQGYYTGNIDGQFGDQTRDALGAYQRDHELEITAAIDEPTVQSLGLVTEES